MGGCSSCYGESVSGGLFSITTTVSFAFSFKDVLVWCAPSTRSGISAVSDAVLGVLVNQMKACIGL